MRSELSYTDVNGAEYALRYDDEDDGVGVVLIQGSDGRVVSLPAPVLMAMIHRYQLDTRYNEVTHRELSDSDDGS